MQAIEIRPGINVGLDEVIRGVSAVNTAELEFFLSEIQNILTSRKSKMLPAQETDLLLIINQGISVALRQKYNLLTQKMNDNNLTPLESEEIKKLVDAIEIQDAIGVKMRC